MATERGGGRSEEGEIELSANYINKCALRAKDVDEAHTKNARRRGRTKFDS